MSTRPDPTRKGQTSPRHREALFPWPPSSQAPERKSQNKTMRAGPGTMMLLLSLNLSACPALMGVLTAMMEPLAELAGQISLLLLGSASARLSSILIQTPIQTFVDTAATVAWLVLVHRVVIVVMREIIGQKVLKTIAIAGLAISKNGMIV